MANPAVELPRFVTQKSRAVEVVIEGQRASDAHALDPVTREMPPGLLRKSAVLKTYIVGECDAASLGL